MTAIVASLSLVVWSLALLTMLLPLRWAVLCAMLLVHIDLSGPDFASATSIGLENGLKLALVPLVLLYRTKDFAIRIPSSTPNRLWLLLCAYTVVASAWSPYPVSALKLVTYMVTYSVVFVIYYRCYAQRLLDQEIISIAVIAGLLLAAIQTWLAGNVFGTEDGRFTSFTSPQAFAASMAALAAILLFKDCLPSTRLGDRLRVPALICAYAAIVLSGSRYVTVGAIVVFLWWLYQRKPRRASRAKKWRNLALVAIVLSAGLYLLEAIELPEDSRLVQLQEAILSRSSLEDIGTVAFRLEMYGDIIDRLQHGSMTTLLIGHGTSSGGEIAVQDFDGYSSVDVDANRVLHNEYLRAIYEWGVIGGALFIGFVVSSLRQFWRARQNPATRAFIAFAPTLVVGLLIENVLASSGAPSGNSIALVFAMASASVSLAKVA